MAHDRIHDDCRPNDDSEADLLPKHADRLKIISCLEMTVVDVEHTFIQNTRFIITECCVKGHSECVVSNKIAYGEDDYLETDVNP